MTPTRRHVPILIIGSGVAGCTAALTLADAGCDVLLLNAGDNLADGNSELAQGESSIARRPGPTIPPTTMTPAPWKKTSWWPGTTTITARPCAGSANKARSAWTKC